MGLQGKEGESGNTEEREKSRLKVSAEVSSPFKSDDREKLRNIRVQSWEFFVESDDSLFLPQIIPFICLLLIMLPRSVSFPQHPGKTEELRRGERERGRAEKSSGVLVSLNGSRWIWREKLTAWLLILLLRQHLAVGQLESESLGRYGLSAFLHKHLKSSLFNMHQIRPGPQPACVLFVFLNMSWDHI